ncbi:MAG: septal ring lytic transglycosylase RlpA family protein [Treponema sp.]|nr:septal ring lytic transglycosylase RlpA family protein [Treponema sp.]
MKMRKLLLAVVMAATTFAFAQDYYKTNVLASYYGAELQGAKTASGETFNMYDYTAAHNSMPFNTLVKVTNIANSKSVIVRINDRGPYSLGREIDLSQTAADALDMVRTGTARVNLEVIQWGTNNGPTTDVSGVTETPFIVNEAPLEIEEKHYDVQLGAYSEFANAQIMANRLYKAGFTNIAYQSENNITRVVLRDVSASDLDFTVESLKQNGFTDYLVRQRKLDSTPALETTTTTTTTTRTTTYSSAER